MVVAGAAVVDSGIITETVAVSARKGDIAVNSCQDCCIDIFWFHFARFYFFLQKNINNVKCRPDQRLVCSLLFATFCFMLENIYHLKGFSAN